MPSAVISVKPNLIFSLTSRFRPRFVTSPQQSHHICRGMSTPDKTQESFSRTLMGSGSSKSFSRDSSHRQIRYSERLKKENEDLNESHHQWGKTELSPSQHNNLTPSAIRQNQDNERLKKENVDLKKKSKSQEEEIKSLKDKVAKDVALSIKTGKAESLNNPVSQTRLKEMYDDLRRRWPKIKRHLKLNKETPQSVKDKIQAGCPTGPMGPDPNLTGSGGIRRSRDILLPFSSCQSVPARPRNAEEKC
ncbi:hypothetical protein XENOCAPTIV_005030 [Xenoophorus captivus]|uniref:Uncharacterized protein n=1 Tax=Xenoophorus captivus TaxID=1517983 RepID=A0ABV0R8D3_9TELE